MTVFNITWFVVIGGVHWEVIALLVIVREGREGGVEIVIYLHW